MAEKNFIITSPSGLHARPATKLVQAASQFDSKLTLTYNGTSVNLKSIMGVMSLAAGQGANLKITAVGSDENEVLPAIENALKTSKLID